MALGQHLGADEQRGVGRVQTFELTLQAAAPRGCIAVDADQRHVGEARGEKALELLRALTKRMQLGRTAFGTYLRHPPLRAAMGSALTPQKVTL